MVRVRGGGVARNCRTTNKDTHQMDNNILSKLSDETIVSDADARVTADLAALDPEDLVQVNLEITPAVTTVLGVLPELKALREQIAKELPTFDLASFDK